ncbi:unnamed protein product [Callosobruchus maculatus]|uniref:Uncharacterized protein n=1 Tax=Callosobruchus maculatus TaxID=64391 RepID=A0A653DJR9_CALMS|nr:unnamed protein product [Callosobruchus maculatus]
MNAKAPQKAETYETLLEKEKSISSSISDMEKQLSSINASTSSGNTQPAEEDSLDTFMKELSESKPQKLEVNRLKRELLKLKADHAKVIRLVNIAKPAELPPLVAKYETEQKDVKSKTMPMIGKRKKLKVQLPSKPSEIYIANDFDDEEEDEDEEDRQEKELKSTVENPLSEKRNVDNAEEPTIVSSPEASSSVKHERVKEKPRALSPSSESDNEKIPARFSIKKLENMVKKGLPSFAEKHKDTLEKIVATFNSVITTNGKMHLDIKTLAVKKRKVTKLLTDLKNSKSNEKMDQEVSMQLNNVLNDLKSMCKQESIVAEGTKIIPDPENKDAKGSGEVKPFKLKARLLPQQHGEDEDSSDEECTNDEKKRRRNQRRIQQRQMKADKEKLKGYSEDAGKEDYNMWVPPTDQSGDGRTHLNEKFGY